MIAGSLSEHPGAASFAQEFQERHVEEIAFLLDHREVQMRLGRWTDTEKHERRIAAHVNAVEAHGAGALDVATGLLASPDRTVRPGAAYLLAALGGAGQRAALMASLAEGAPAIARAIALAQTSALAVAIEQAIGKGDEALGVAGAAVLGFGGETPTERLLEVAATVDSDVVLGALALAIARRGSRAAWPALRAALRRDPANHQLIRGMVLAGDPEGLPRARAALSPASAPAPAPDTAILACAVALAGDLADVPLLAAHFTTAPVAVLQALGLLGIADAFPTILPHLESPDAAVRRAAGVALETLTGARLPASEPSRLAQGLDDDAEALDLDVDPLMNLEARTLPVCTDVVAWQAFWHRDGERLRQRGGRTRLRRGLPWSAEVASGPCPPCRCPRIRDSSKPTSWPPGPRRRR